LRFLKLKMLNLKKIKMNIVKIAAVIFKGGVGIISNLDMVLTNFKRK